MHWPKYPESLKPIVAAVLMVGSAAYLVFTFFQQANEVRVFLLGLPLWVGQGLAVVFIVAMLMVMQDRAYGRLNPPDGIAVLPPAPAPEKAAPWWRRKSVPKEATSGLSFAERKADLAEERAKDLEGQLATLERGHAQLGEKLAKVAAERDGWKEACSGREEELRYGAPLITAAPMAESEYVAIRPQLEELQQSVETALDSAEKVWQEVVFRCRTQGDASAVWWLERFVSDRVASLGRVARLFREQLQHGRDPRPALARLYVLYRDWRKWIVRLAKMVDLQPGWGGYKEWQDAETQFDAELRKKLRITQLREVADAVVEYDRAQDEGNGHLPPPGSSW